MTAKWKQRQLKAKSDLENAEKAARYRAFWESVPPVKPVRVPVDFERLPV